MTFWVGRNDKRIPVLTFDTYEEAVEQIAIYEDLDPIGVHNGEYYIDGPEQ